MKLRSPRKELKPKHHFTLLKKKGTKFPDKSLKPEKKRIYPPQMFKKTREEENNSCINL